MTPPIPPSPGARAPERRCQRAPRRYSILTPTVLWSVVLFAIAPSHYGFGLGSIPNGRSSSVSPASGGSADAKPRAGRAGVASAAELMPGARGSQGSRFAPASWFKERIRDGSRRIHMQVMSMAPETQTDATSFEDAPVPAAERGFQINGWRWHSRAAILDVARFRRVALLAVEASSGPDGGGKEGKAAVERVVKSFDFIWTFSFLKLHKTETSLFFPWLRELLPKEALPYLDEFDREREAVVRLGTKMGQLVAEAQQASKKSTSPRAALLRCADLSEELESRALRLSRAQEAVIVPYTAAYVSNKDQWKFNDKVIFSLGLVDSQVFLVAMHDAIKSNKEEFNTFRSQVPKFARALIPTWRRVLYSPRAGCLEDAADAKLSE